MCELWYNVYRFQNAIVMNREGVHISLCQFSQRWQLSMVSHYACLNQEILDFLSTHTHTTQHKRKVLAYRNKWSSWGHLPYICKGNTISRTPTIKCGCVLTSSVVYFQFLFSFKEPWQGLDVHQLFYKVFAVHWDRLLW